VITVGAERLSLVLVNDATPNPLLKINLEALEEIPRRSLLQRWTRAPLVY
jgi:hypothetical protein